MAEKHDRHVESFDDVDLTISSWPLITVYEKPSDYPDKFVARLWDVDKPTVVILTADTLEELRWHKPVGMVTLMRNIEDDPNIVEVWI